MLVPSARISGASLPRYAVVIVLDGTRPGYFNLAPMPNLRALMARGVTYNQAFVGQEIANTPPSHATIGTGLFPKHHGVQGFQWKDPATNAVTRPSDLAAVESGALEQVESQHRVPSLAASTSSSAFGGKSVSISGHKCYAADAMGTAAANYILCSMIYHDRWVAQAIGSHRPPPGAINNPRWDVPIPPPHSGLGPAVEQWKVGAENDWTVKYALWAFHRVHYPRLLMINLPETDVIGHYAPTSAPLRVLMKRFDRELGSIIAAYRAAGLLGRTDFVVTADHGMSRIKNIVPYHLLEEAIAMAGTRAVYIEADTAAAMGLRESEMARVVSQSLGHIGGPNVDAVYYKSVHNQIWSYHLGYARSGLSATLLRAYHILINTAASDTGPDVFAVYGPHTSTHDFASNGYTWVAGHLGPQWGDQHIPLVIAGPGIRHGATSSYPARLVDIAPTIDRLLHQRSGKVDGSVLSDALVHASPTKLARQSNRARLLVPLVRALEKRSR
ncbi:MAG: alkaline phosphatase family protein [Chloroflexota bacterium]